MIRPAGAVFVLKNWKLVVHLILGTKRFGVNNRWSSNFDSLFTRQGGLTLRLIIKRYKLAKMRAVHLGFLHPDTCRALGWIK